MMSLLLNFTLIIFFIFFLYSRADPGPGWGTIVMNRGGTL